MSESEPTGTEVASETGLTDTSEFEDKDIHCIDCSTNLVWTVGEQAFFRDKKLQNPPKRCKECKQAKNERLAAIAAAQASGVRQRIEVAVNCAKCGETTPNEAAFCGNCGAAMGAPAVSVRAEIDAFSGTFAGGAIAMGIAALKRAYPEARLGRYLSDAGRAAVAASAHDCLAEAAVRNPFLSMDDLERRPGVLDRPKLDGFLRSISPRYMPGHPEVPVFHYHDATDEFAPFGPALKTMKRWCRRGSTVDVHVDPVGEHIAYLAVGAPLAVAYLADRFAGAPAPNGCASPPLSG